MSSLRASAERALFGTTLADKLAPFELDDHLPGDAIAVPLMPGRPPGLAPSATRAPFPRDLHNPDSRARVLHFLANHELLALELIALALLRFPDAEPGWRRGMVAILGQEQDHLRGYLDRLAVAGLAFGDQPLNTYFWSALCGARTPQQFMAGLSLTFEQANLDHAVAFAARFRAVGDEEGAAHLDLVLRDETEHVAHGVRWLGIWRPDTDFWTAWTDLLEPPLSPARAKGTTVVVEPRLAAGIPQAVIDRLTVWSASKGRPPVVGWFTPDVESEVGAGEARAPRGTGSAGERIGGDLATLPMFLLGADDHVLAPEPGVRWLRGLQAVGFAIPGFGVDLPERVGGWLPWGWSPTTCARAGVPWDPRWRDLYSKAWLQEGFGEGRVARTEAELEALGAPGMVLKAPYSTAGRGLKRWERPDRPGWARRVLAEQGALVVEPWEERVVDLSVQFTVGGTLKIQPWSRFLVDAQGRYRGACVGRQLEGLDRDVLRWIRSTDPQAELERVIRPLAAAMAERGFSGFAGIDAYVARTPGGYRLRRLVELNPRVTMGRIAAAVGRRVRRERFGLMRVVTAGQLAAEGTDPVAWTSRMAGLPTPRLRDGLIDEGTLMLTEPLPDRRAWVVLEVGATGS